MKKLSIFTILLLILSIGSVKSQDEEWEQSLHLTGYVNAVAEYSNCRNLEKEYVAGLSEVGFLATYRPTEKLEFKTTLVYTHFTFDVSQIFVEAYAKYRFADEFTVGAGRFLTPLSPSNLYFYAPLNVSGVTPMLISHHFLFPQNISGFQIEGLANLNDDIKLGYNFSLGTYTDVHHFAGGGGGVMGIVSQEDYYPSFGFNNIKKRLRYTKTGVLGNYLSGTGRIYLDLFDAVKIGGNYFTGDSEHLVQLGTVFYPLRANKYTYGVDFHLNVAGFKLNAEYWKGEQDLLAEGREELKSMYVNYDTGALDKQKYAKALEQSKSSYSAAYAELIYDNGAVKPFVRYDFIDDFKSSGFGIPTQAATIGIAYRPLFEVLLKLEYRYIDTKIVTPEKIKYDEITDTDKIIAPAASNPYNYNYVQMSCVFSF